MDDYPTDIQLNVIRKWNPSDLDGLMGYIFPLWQFADCGYWSKINDSYHISTAGWSGNEDIIAAMQDNQVWWAFFWKSSRRGGHYIFQRLTLENIDANTE